MKVEAEVEVEVERERGERDRTWYMDSGGEGQWRSRRHS